MIRSSDEMFQETIIKQWTEPKSAEEVAHQNQEEIAKYGAPPHATIVSREVQPIGK